MADRPLRADAQRNRDKVLRAAQEAFAASGYGVPLDEIAAMAGVGPGTVYRHFPSKEELFEAVVTARLRDLIAAARGLADDPDPGPAFFAFLGRFRQEVRVARQGSHPNVCRVYDLGEADGNLYKLGGQYFLSKRTALYGDVGYVKNSSLGNFSVLNTGPIWSVGKNQFAAVLGVRHSF